MASYNNLYSQQESMTRFTMFPPVIKWLILINLGIFVLGQVPIDHTVSGAPVLLKNYFQFYAALWPVGSEPFMPWQYFSYMFLHGGFFHVFLNLLGLWMFGIELENIWGSKRFLVYYILSGLGAGIIHSIVTLWSSGPGTEAIPTVGASGAVFAVLLAFGMFFPNRVVLMGFFFPMKAKYAVMLFIGLELYSGIANNPGDNVAHFAHLGGVLVGYLLLRTNAHVALANLFRKKTEPIGQGQPHANPYSYAPREGNIIDVNYRDVPSAPQRQTHVKMDFGNNQAMIDTILDKISKGGYQNLTQEEKDILFEASKKMR